MVGAHVQAVSKVLHEVSSHHITTSASIAGVHIGGWDFNGVIWVDRTYEVRRNDQSGSVEFLDERVRRLAHKRMMFLTNLISTHFLST